MTCSGFAPRFSVTCEAWSISAKMRAGGEQALAQRRLRRGERFQRLEGEHGGRHEAHEMAERDVAVDALPAAIEDRRRQPEAGHRLRDRAHGGARARRLHEVFADVADDLAEALRLALLLAVGLYDAHALQRLRQHAAEIAGFLQRAADRLADALFLPAEVEDRRPARRSARAGSAASPCRTSRRPGRRRSARS